MIHFAVERGVEPGKRGLQNLYRVTVRNQQKRLSAKISLEVDHQRRDASHDPVCALHAVAFAIRIDPVFFPDLRVCAVRPHFEITEVTFTQTRVSGDGMRAAEHTARGFGRLAGA